MYRKSLKLALDIGFVRYQSSPLEKIGDIYLLLENKEKALKYFTLAYNKASKNKFTSGIKSIQEKLNQFNN